jgi:hypothetical protein
VITPRDVFIASVYRCGRGQSGVRVEGYGNIEGGSMIRRCEDKTEVLEEMFEDHETFKKIRRRQRAPMPVSGSRSSIRAARRRGLAKWTGEGDWRRGLAKWTGEGEEKKCSA